jgi:hypothetical protein
VPYPHFLIIPIRGCLNPNRDNRLTLRRVGRHVSARNNALDPGAFVRRLRIVNAALCRATGLLRASSVNSANGEEFLAVWQQRHPAEAPIILPSSLRPTSAIMRVRNLQTLLIKIGLRRPL